MLQVLRIHNDLYLSYFSTSKCRKNNLFAKKKFVYTMYLWIDWYLTSIWQSSNKTRCDPLGHIILFQQVFSLNPYCNILWVDAVNYQFKCSFDSLKHWFMPSCTWDKHVAIRPPWGHQGSSEITFALCQILCMLYDDLKTALF